jgi:para-nitrobenzyl esterase
VYAYIFTYESQRIVPGTQHRVGAAHALEIAYKFDLVGADQKTGDAAPTATRTMMDTGPDSVKTADNMSQIWSNFARTGRPGAKGQPDWPAYDTTRRATMLINAECKIVDDPFGRERSLWERLES